MRSMLGEQLEVCLAGETWRQGWWGMWWMRRRSWRWFNTSWPAFHHVHQSWSQSFNFLNRVVIVVVALVEVYFAFINHLLFHFSLFFLFLREPLFKLPILPIPLPVSPFPPTPTSLSGHSEKVSCNIVRTLKKISQRGGQGSRVVSFFLHLLSERQTTWETPI